MVGARTSYDDSSCADSYPERDGYSSWGNSCGGEDVEEALGQELVGIGEDIGQPVRGPRAIGDGYTGGHEGTAELEILDLRTVKPLDTDTIMASVARTGRVLCVGESFPWGGVTAEVVSRIASEAFALLDAPPMRLNAKDTPIPYHPNLWAAHRPTAQAIATASRKLVRM